MENPGGNWKIDIKMKMGTDWFTMDGPNERLMKSIFEKDLNVITLNNGG